MFTEKAPATARLSTQKSRGSYKKSRIFSQIRTVLRSFARLIFNQNAKFPKNPANKPLKLAPKANHHASAKPRQSNAPPPPDRRNQQNRHCEERQRRSHPRRVSHASRIFSPHAKATKRGRR
jgi:hypothetical protein